MRAKKTLLSWSSGKDSAWALNILRKDPCVEVAGLFTTVNARVGRASMHGTSVHMLERQAWAAGLPLEIVRLPDPCDGKTYSGIMRGFLKRCKGRGIQCMAFGDVHLEDVRAYREERLVKTGIEPLFPLWGTPPRELAGRMLASGMEAFLSCVDLKVLDESFLGRKWTTGLMDELPKGCDPLGEKGEFHTIVTGGPMFSRAVPVVTGGIVRADGFAYVDIVPAL